jgi:hypothetical protein
MKAKYFFNFFLIYLVFISLVVQLIYHSIVVNLKRTKFLSSIIYVISIYFVI